MFSKKLSLIIELILQKLLMRHFKIIMKGKSRDFHCHLVIKTNHLLSLNHS